MKTGTRNITSVYKGLVGVAMAMMLGMGTIGPACAGHGAAWGIGGLIAGSALTKAADRDERRTKAAEYQAYSQPPAVAQPAAPAPSATSIEQKLNDLDALAAKGYITKEEYQARRQALLDSL